MKLSMILLLTALASCPAYAKGRSNQSSPKKPAKQRSQRQRAEAAPPADDNAWVKSPDPDARQHAEVARFVKDPNGRRTYRFTPLTEALFKKVAFLNDEQELNARRRFKDMKVRYRDDYLNSGRFTSKEQKITMLSVLMKQEMGLDSHDSNQHDFTRALFGIPVSEGAKSELLLAMFEEQGLVTEENDPVRVAVEMDTRDSMKVVLHKKRTNTVIPLLECEPVTEISARCPERAPQKQGYDGRALVLSDAKEPESDSEKIFGDKYRERENSPYQRLGSGAQGAF